MQLSLARGHRGGSMMQNLLKLSPLTHPSPANAFIFVTREYE